MTDIRKYSIAALFAKATKEGYGDPYIQDVMEASVSFDEYTGVYQLAYEDFLAIRKKYPLNTETTLEYLTRGVVGIAKAATRRDRAEEGTIKHRLDVCKSCDEYKNGRCGKCGCFLRFKTAIESESCPLGKW